MTKISIILGVSVVLMLFIFLLVGHHRNIPDRVRQDRSELLGAGSSPVGQVSVPAADSQREPVKKAAGVAAPKAPLAKPGGKAGKASTALKPVLDAAAGPGGADTAAKEA